MDLPWLHFRPSSSTFASVESSISGTLIIFVARSRKALTSATSSRSGSCRQTSMTWAPFLTCARAISAAASNWPSATRRLNFRLPSTLVRSPTRTGRLSTSTSSASMPETSGLVVDRHAARLLAFGRGRERADVRRGRAAAAAHDVDPALRHEPLELARQRRRRFRVLPVRVGQPGVRVARRPRLRDRREAAEVVRHELRARGAVQADREQRRVHDRGVERLDVLAGEHRAHGLDRDRHHHRRPPPDLGERLLDADQPGLEVARVLRRLEQENVRAAREQAERLRPVVDDHLVEGHASRDRHRLGRRPHRPRDEPQAPGRRSRGRRLARELGRAAVELDGPVREAVLGEHERRPAERVGLDHVRARGEIIRVHSPHQVRPRDHQVLVAPLELRAAEILGREVLSLDPGPRRAVEHEDPLGEKLLERLGPFALRRAVGGPFFGHGKEHYAGLRAPRAVRGRRPERLLVP